MKITEYTQIKKLDSSDVFLLDGTDGTRLITAADLFFALGEHIAPEAHRTIFRGKNLGTEFTDAQLAAIQNGFFEDLWLGDYWVISGKTWRIVDMNYFINRSYATTPHLVIMPDTYLYTAAMNSSNTTAGGYAGSTMYKTGLNTAKTTIKAAFNNHVWSHKEYLSNDVTDGIVTGCSEYSVEVALPTETMMYGHTIWASPFNKDGVTDNLADLYPYDHSQFALFATQPKFIVDTTNWNWLRDVVSAGYFAVVDDGGGAGCGDAYASGGVRPYFCVG